MNLRFWKLYSRVSQSGPSALGGHHRHSGGKRVRGGPWTVKELQGAMSSYFESYEDQKNVLGVFYGSLETYTRYFWVADEEKKKRF